MRNAELPQSGESGQAAGLPNDCAITATEAAARLSATGAWTQIIFVTYFDQRIGRTYAHALAVWQPPTTHIVCIYDEGGTWDLETDKHDAAEIACQWAELEHVVLISAHFLK